MTTKHLQDMIAPGSWRGRRSFVVAGGPSLRDFDFSLLEGELTIGVNRAYERFSPVVNYSMDSDFFSWVESGVFGPAAQRRWFEGKFIKAFLDIGAFPYPPDIVRVKNRQNKAAGLTLDLSQGIYAGPNSGYGAIVLAAALGSTEIYVLGLDMRGQDGKQAWWHSGYPKVKESKIYERAKEKFEELAKFLEEKGVKVFNLSAESALECWPKIPWTKVWRVAEVRTHLGFGDNIYEAPFVRAIAGSGQYDRVYVKTPFPQLHAGTARTRFVRSGTSLAAAAAAEKSWEEWAETPPDPVNRISFYDADRAEGAARPERFSKATGVRPDMKINLRHEWIDQALSAIRGRLDPCEIGTRKLCAVNQPTLRKEWLVPARNPDAGYIELCMDRIRDEYYFVSVANIREGEEWIDGSPELRADIRLLNGELDLFGVAGLVWLSDLVICGPSFMVPLALSIDRPVLAIYGGYEPPSAHFSENLYGRRDHALYVAPEPFCACKDRNHACHKGIPAERLFDAVDRVTGRKHAAV